MPFRVCDDCVIYSSLEPSSSEHIASNSVYSIVLDVVKNVSFGTFVKEKPGPIESKETFEFKIGEVRKDLEICVRWMKQTTKARQDFFLFPRTQVVDDLIEKIRRRNRDVEWIDDDEMLVLDPKKTVGEVLRIMVNSIGEEVPVKVGFEQLSERDQIRKIENLKSDGDMYLKEKRLEKSIVKFKKCIRLISQCLSKGKNSNPSNQENQSQLQTLKLACLGNASTAYLLLKSYGKVIENSLELLKEDPDNFKAHYRLNKAYRAEEEFNLSLQALSKCLQLANPKQKESLEKEYSQVSLLKKSQTQKQRKLYSGMFG